MWIFTSKAFASIVQHDGKPGYMIARARFKGHLEILFPRTRVSVTPGKDYRFRCIVTQERAAKALFDAAMAIDYGNFKNSIPMTAYFQNYHAAASEVWGVMYRAQLDALPRKKRLRSTLSKLTFAPEDYDLPEDLCLR
jgi:hypothetical protein